MKYEITQSPLHLGASKTVKVTWFCLTKIKWVLMSSYLVKNTFKREKRKKTFVQAFKSWVLLLTLGYGFTAAHRLSCLECLSQNDVGFW